jgi:hypothetical protein
MVDGLKRIAIVLVLVVTLVACSGQAASPLIGKWGATEYSQNHGVIGLDFSTKGVVTITNAGMVRSTSTAEYDDSKPGVVVVKGPIGQQPFFYRVDGDVLTLSEHEDFSDPMTLHRGVSPPTQPPYRSKI